MASYAALGRPRECVLHDPLSASICIEPTIITTEKFHVDVETRGEITRGMTVVDRRDDPEYTPNVDVGVAVETECFVRSFIDSIVTYLVSYF